MVQSRSESVWTESNGLRITWAGEPLTYADRAMDAVGKYIEDERHKDMFQTVDHVALFTGSVQCSIRFIRTLWGAVV